MLVELGLVEERYKAVTEVLEGASVVDVARRNGVARQTVNDGFGATGPAASARDDGEARRPHRPDW